jgi:hypothetical protein
LAYAITNGDVAVLEFDDAGSDAVHVQDEVRPAFADGGVNIG